METKMSIDPERIHEIFNDCLFKDNESHSEYLPAKGLTMSVGFHPERTEKHASEIHELCMNLLAEFQEDIGGGHSFLYMCMDKDGNYCMEQPTAQELLLLGIATGWMSFLMPREVWSVLPGGVPFVVVNTQRSAVNICKAKGEE